MSLNKQIDALRTFVDEKFVGHDDLKNNLKEVINNGNSIESIVKDLKSCIGEGFTLPQQYIVVEQSFDVVREKLSDGYSILIQMVDQLISFVELFNGEMLNCHIKGEYARYIVPDRMMLLRTVNDYNKKIADEKQQNSLDLLKKISSFVGHKSRGTGPSRSVSLLKNYVLEYVPFSGEDKEVLLSKLFAMKQNFENDSQRVLFLEDTPDPSPLLSLSKINNPFLAQESESYAAHYQEAQKVREHAKSLYIMLSELNGLKTKEELFDLGLTAGVVSIENMEKTVLYDRYNFMNGILNFRNTDTPSMNTGAQYMSFEDDRFSVSELWNDLNELYFYKKTSVKNPEFNKMYDIVETYKTGVDELMETLK